MTPAQPWEVIIPVAVLKYVSVLDAGAVGNGVQDDTAAIISAVSQTPGGGTLYFPGGRTYLTDQFTIDKRIRMLGDGKTSTTIKAKTGAIGPLLNANNASFRPGFTAQGFTLDMTLAPAIQAAYFHNVRNGRIQDIRVDHGTIGIQMDRTQAMTIQSCESYDTSVNGFLQSDSVSSSNTYIDCIYDATVVGGTSGFTATAGIDTWYIGCRSFRSPGAAFTVNYGFQIDYAVNNFTATVKLLGCSADGISDKTSDSTVVAALFFRNVGECDVVDTWADGYSVGDLTSNKSVEIANCKEIRFVGNRMGGRGVQWTGAASSGMHFSANRFLDGSVAQVGANPGMYVIPAVNPPTNVYEHGSIQDIQSLQTIPLFNDVTRWNTAKINKPAVAGSRAGNAALASLLTALAGQDAIVDNTTA